MPCIYPDEEIMGDDSIDGGTIVITGEDVGI